MSMMKRWIALALCLTVLCGATFARAEVARLSVQGFQAKTQNQSGRKIDSPFIVSFLSDYPDVKLNLSSKTAYGTTKKLLQALESKQLKDDVFTVESPRHDPQTILSSSYCLDLTDNTVIAELLSLMHPTIAETVMVDGRIYGVPIGLSTTKQLYYLDRAWEAAGLTAEDVPTSYTGLLDFLESWILRMQTDPVAVCVSSDYDAESVKPTTYANWLLGLLLRSYVNQCVAAGLTLSFDDPALKTLMERTKTVAARLYELHEWERPNEYGALFTELSGVPQSMLNLVPTRLTDQDPMLISATVTMACVNAHSSQPEIAQAFIAQYLRWIHDHTADAYGILDKWDNSKDQYTDDDHAAELSKALLFMDASGPIHSANPQAVAMINQAIQLYQDLLDGNAENLTRAQRNAIPRTEEQRQKVQGDIAFFQSEAYYAARYRAALDFTEEELLRYQDRAQYLVFLSDSGFDVDANAVTRLLTRYASDGITAEELCKKLQEQVQQ